MLHRPTISSLPDTLVPYAPLFRSDHAVARHPARVRVADLRHAVAVDGDGEVVELGQVDVRASVRAVVRHRGVVDGLGVAEVVDGGPPDRSDEHTSELQSLMRISYAGFRLKKKNKIQTKNDRD